MRYMKFSIIETTNNTRHVAYDGLELVCLLGWNDNIRRKKHSIKGSACNYQNLICRPSV